MKKLCVIDQVEFDAKRADAKYCSDACRKKDARNKGVDPNTGEILEKPSSTSVDNGSLSLEDQEYTVKAKKLGVSLVEYKRRLNAFIKMGVAEVEWIATGIPDFDALTMIPRGRVTQIQGRYGAGKTTLCLNMIKGLRGRKVLYIDTEAALSPDLLMGLDIDDRNFTLYNESSYIEDVSEIIRAAAKNGQYDIIVLDSVPMTTTKSIEASDITSKNIGQKAFILHKLMELIAMDLKRTNTAMVFINQVRDVIGVPYSDTYTPGGSAIPFQASLIVQLKSAKSWRFPRPTKDAKTHIFLGQEVEATIIKSKVNGPGRVAKFKLYYPNPSEMSVEAVDTKEEF